MKIKFLDKKYQNRTKTYIIFQNFTPCFRSKNVHPKLKKIERKGFFLKEEICKN